MSVFISFEDLNKYVSNNSGQCLSYDPTSGVGKFTCAQSHSWMAVAERVIQGEWCPKCKRSPRTITIQLLAASATALCSATLIESTYLGLRSSYTLRCKHFENHVWRTQGASILSGKSGCRKCAGLKRRLSLEEVSKQIGAAGYYFISPSQSKKYGRYVVMCPLEHRWETTLGRLREGKGCPYCSKKARHTIADAIAEGNRRNIVCRSDTLKNSRSSLSWRCRTCNYEWISSLTSLMSTKYGCPNCARDAAALALRLPIEQLQKVAADRGGKLRTSSYVRGEEQLEWECAYGHSWFADAYHVVTRGTWCQECHRLGIGKPSAA